MPDEKITPGQAAFEKWVSLLDRHDDWMYWRNLSGAAKAGWEEVAKAAIDANS